MKSITFLMHNIYAVGGTVKTITNLANQLSKQGHSVKIITIFKTQKAPYFHLDHRVKIEHLINYQIDIRNIIPLCANRIRKFTPLLKPRHLSHFEPGFKQYSSYIEKRLIRAIEHDHSDILIGTRASHNILIARFARPEQITIGMEHMNFTAHHPQLRAEIIQYYNHLNAITTLTEEDQACYASELDIPVFLLPNMIDEKRHQIMKLKRIISVGRFEYEKGFDILIEAVYKIQEELREQGYTVEIYGEGPEKEALGQQINFLRLQDLVALKPATQHISVHLAESQITCVPSRNEGFGMTILEAMNQGSIVVSFDGNVGPRALIKHQVNGYLVPHLNVELLGQQLLEVIAHSYTSRTKSIIANGYQTVENYGPEDIYQQFLTIIHQI
ncbi:glycosyltransferase family 4 protein [Staphylococcus canis]|uniref:Glycosyltransferase family 4 protein n=1 Tax=Staphylococcus canis TaxID=2724942 RepID=A0ABS0T976_9STAP|nr:glycosyltransferase family 4 protein [Staphylococcus canis]MBI5974308.1 glycosyltransferase family 4 protein [Staphylococcus canis]